MKPFIIWLWKWTTNLPEIVIDVDECNLTPSVPDATITDNCDNDIDVVFTETTSQGGCGLIYTWTWTATDDCGNQSIETEVFNSTDDEPPTITGVPEDITIYCDDVPAVSSSDCSYIIQNVALNKPVTQSSTGYGGVATRAVDGNTNGSWGNGSVTHTNNTANAWWELDLEEVFEIDSIEIWGRTDCCSDRLSDYYV